MCLILDLYTIWLTYFPLIGFLIFWSWTYLMKVISEKKSVMSTKLFDFPETLWEEI
jgi:hypothetical protein